MVKMRRLERSLYKKSGGFTLIELVMVMMVLGIISLIAMPRFVSVRELIKKMVCESNHITLV